MRLDTSQGRSNSGAYALLGCASCSHRQRYFLVLVHKTGQRSARGSDTALYKRAAQVHNQPEPQPTPLKLTSPMPPPAQLKPKRSRPHARRSGKHSGPFFRVKKCPAAAFTGAMRYGFSSVFYHSQTSVTRGGEASEITYLHNAKGQRAFKSEPQVA